MVFKRILASSLLMNTLHLSALTVAMWTDLPWIKQTRRSHIPCDQFYPSLLSIGYLTFIAAPCMLIFEHLDPKETSRTGQNLAIALLVVLIGIPGFLVAVFGNPYNPWCAFFSLVAYISGGLFVGYWSDFASFWSEVSTVIALQLGIVAFMRGGGFIRSWMYEERHSSDSVYLEKVVVKKDDGRYSEEEMAGKV